MLKAVRSRLIGWRSSLTWRVLSNAGWASAATPIQIGLGIVQTALMARMLGPEGIGTLALFGSVCALFGSILKITNTEAAMVYVTKALGKDGEEHAGHYIRYFLLLDFLSSLVAFLAIALSALFVPRLLKLASGSEWLQALFGLTVVFQSTYWTSHALLRVANRFSWTFYHALAHSVVKTGLVALLFASKAGLKEVVILLVGVSLLDGGTLTLLAGLAQRRVWGRLAPEGARWWQVPGEIRRFQLLGQGREIVKSMNRYVDTLLIGYIGNPAEVGYYRGGTQMTSQLQVPAQGFLASLFPEYSRLYFEGDMPRLRRLVGRFLVLFLLVGLMVGLIFWFGAGWIITLVLGQSFLPALDVVRILAISGVILLAMSPIYSLPAAVGRAGPALKAVGTAIVVQVLLMVWLVPKLGALGAAWANLAYTLTWALVLLPNIVQVLRGPGEGQAAGLDKASKPVSSLPVEADRV